MLKCLWTYNKSNQNILLLSEIIQDGLVKDVFVNGNTEVLFLFLFVYTIGLTGIVFNFRNYLVTMLAIEIMYLGITVCFLLWSVLTFDPKGQIFALSLLIVAAAESAIGLGLLIVIYKFGKSIDFSDYENLNG